jgi:hypothetical protein
MSNYCVNYLQIIGNDSNEIERFQNLITNNNDKTNNGLLLETKTTSEVIFDVYINDDNRIDFLTKYTTNIDMFKELSELFPTLTIKLEYMELGYDVFGKATFENGTVKHKQLSESDFELITECCDSDVDIETYKYKDFESESREEVIEYLFEDLYNEFV